jgi:hypothetical protein
MATEGEPVDRVVIAHDGEARQAALAHALLLEALDCLNQVSELTDGDVSASLCRHAAELTTLAQRLNPSAN